ncbi:MAG: ABC-F family ATP-binding cassette domain-containing protein [Deltaproteobacteria bacterium]|nr:ABC-F family ATP-binding cassette domain-containing protein [Deltaproteobacteria bacterium]
MGKYLFRDVSLHVGDGDRIAFVGSNGAGKSTLMKIITGIESADTGNIVRSKLHTTGYLPQDSIYHRGKTLYAEIEQVFENIINLQARIEAIGNEISLLSNSSGESSQRLQKLMQDLEQTQHEMEHKKGYMTETKIKQVLFGLGFSNGDLQRMTEEFSGGWQMRMAIAKLLLQEPSVILLDEPTNHLDIESIEWLEGYLQSYSGSIILVSHDSRFLDNIVDKVVEISMGETTEYTGNYTAYIKQKEQHADILKSTYANQQKFIKKNTDFIERFRYKNTKATQVQSRIRMLEKLEKIEVEKDERGISFRFPEPPHSGRIVMALEDLTKLYGDNNVFTDISLNIEKGEKIAILGVNGSGKSTLARIIAGIEPFQKGIRKSGQNVVMSYYSQNTAEKLDNSKNVLQTLDTIAQKEAPERLRTLLGCFLFTGDDVFKPVDVLSGGEKSRLALARMLLTPANLLIMDEPTNHLDMRSKAILQESIREYTGSCIIISHDRNFLAPIIDKVFYVSKGNLEVYPGSVDDFLEKQHRDRKEDDCGKVKKHVNAFVLLEKNRKRREAQIRQELYQRLKPLLSVRERIEKDIDKAESQKAQQEAAFIDPKTYVDEGLIQALKIEYARTTSHLEQLYVRWEETEEEIEAIRSHGQEGLNED